MIRCIRKHKIKIIFLLAAIVLIGAAYVYAVYHGYLMLNNPSKRQYPIAGVDLSHYQGEVDWSVLSQQDIQFAYIKATEGSSHVDSCFPYNWEEAKKTSLKYGAYHFRIKINFFKFFPFFCYKSFSPSLLYSVNFVKT